MERNNIQTGSFSGSGRIRWSVDRWTLKWFAAVCMVVDHATAGFMERILLFPEGKLLAMSSDTMYVIDRIGRAIGRQTFPIMAFFLVEGFYRTRSRSRYLGRLVLGALLSERPFYLLFYTGEAGSWMTVSHNTIWTLVLGFLAVWLTDVIWGRQLPWRKEAPQDSQQDSQVKNSRAKNSQAGDLQVRGSRMRALPAGLVISVRTLAALTLCAGIVCLAQKAGVDYGGIGVAAVLACYLFRGIPYGGPAAMLVLLGCCNGLEWFALPGCLLLCCYHGDLYSDRYERKGKSRSDSAQPGDGGGRKGHIHWVRGYVFYLFYPLHLLAIWGLRVLLVGF